MGIMSFEGDVERVRRRLDKFQFMARMTVWAARIGPALASEVRREAPVGTGDNAGALRDSITHKTKVGLGNIKVEIDSGVPYAPFVIYGTRPHEIVPKSARMLHWQNNSSEDVFAFRVNHPGTKPNDFPKRAARKMLGEMAASFAEAFRAI